MSTINVDVINYQSNIFQNVTISGVPIKSQASNQLRVGTPIILGTNTGINETSFGINNLLLSTGNGNTAIGYQVLLNNTTGQANTGLGLMALQYNTTAASNTAIGASALQNTNTGGANTALGNTAGYNNTTGYSNVFVGNTAGNANTTGAINVCVGAGAGVANTTGNSNVFVGNSAGYTQTSGNNNIFLGDSSTGATTTASNAITLGNSSNTILRCAVTSITSLSDARDKKEIVELPVGLEFIEGLKPVSFVWDDRNEEGKHDVKDFGFIAQDLKKSQEDAELSDMLKLVYEENPEKLEASYGKLIPILVKAIQELSAEVKSLKK